MYQGDQPQGGGRRKPGEVKEILLLIIIPVWGVCDSRVGPSGTYMCLSQIYLYKDLDGRNKFDGSVPTLRPPLTFFPGAPT